MVLKNISLFEIDEYGMGRLIGISGMKWEEVNMYDTSNSTMTVFS